MIDCKSPGSINRLRDGQTDVNRHQFDTPSRGSLAHQLCSAFYTWISHVVLPRFQVLMARYTLAISVKVLYNINNCHKNYPSSSYRFYWTIDTTVLPRRYQGNCTKAHAGLPASALRTGEISVISALTKQRKPPMSGNCLRPMWALLVLISGAYSSLSGLPRHECSSLPDVPLCGSLYFFKFTSQSMQLGRSGVPDAGLSAGYATRPTRQSGHSE